MSLSGRGLIVALMLMHGSAAAQWGNRDHQEIGDTLGRDLVGIGGYFDEHDGIFWEYTTGNPDDRNNSILIEMLGASVTSSPVCLSTGIVTCSQQSFVNASTYRGAFRPRQRIPTRTERVAIVDTIEAMKNRPTPIGYINNPFLDYLDWTDTSGDGQLQLGEIINMRSDAVVELAFTLNGFPIIRPSIGNTIITNPNLFRNLADALVTGLRPRDQLYMMNPAEVDTPQLTVYNGGSALADGAATSTPSITVDVFDLYSGPGRLEVWLGAAQTGSLVAVNNDDFNSTGHLYTSADTGLSGISSLANGQYTVRAIDQAGNHASGSFIIGRDQFLVEGRV